MAGPGGCAFSVRQRAPCFHASSHLPVLSRLRSESWEPRGHFPRKREQVWAWGPGRDSISAPAAGPPEGLLECLGGPAVPGGKGTGGLPREPGGAGVE